MGVRKPFKTRKAAYSSVCPECQLPIAAGDWIALAAGERYWVHLEHKVARRTAAAQSWEGPRP